MSDFTQSEQEYIDYCTKLQREIPVRDVSVFQQGISTRQELLETILCKFEGLPKYKLASEMNFTNPKIMLFGRMRQYYNPKSYPFWNLKTEKEFSDMLCAAINNYIPKLSLPEIFIDASTESIKEEFVKHYEASIELLLKGPPHANEHTIDMDRSEQWIKAQKTPERQRLANLLIEKTIYIPHSELLTEVQHCVEQAKQRITHGPIIFVVGSKGKSNYYVSLLFYHFWLQAGLAVDIVKTHMDSFVKGTILDIDEMAYSGTQTTGTLGKVYGNLITNLKQTLDQTNASLQRYAETMNFFPIPFIEHILYTNNVDYFVIRAFCSEMGKIELTKMPPKALYDRNRVKPPFSLIIGKIIPSIETLFGKNDAVKLGKLFGSYPATATYFNHKIANSPSTYLFPYATGVIPNRILFDEEEGNIFPRGTNVSIPKDLIVNPEGNTNEVEFLPFLRFCGKTERRMPSNRSNLLNYVEPGENREKYRASKEELPQEFRCPYAWYKNIEYEQGVHKGGKRVTRKQSTRTRKLYASRR
jgi:hypothetical protein